MVRELCIEERLRGIEKLKEMAKDPKHREDMIRGLIRLVEILAEGFSDDLKALRADKRALKQLLKNWNQEEFYQRLILIKWAIEIRYDQMSEILKELERYTAVFSTYK